MSDENFIELSESIRDDEKVNAVAFVNDLSKRVSWLTSIVEKQTANMRVLTLALVGALFILLVCLYFALSSKTLFFATDSFGRYIPVRSYKHPHLTQERRMGHAEYIVRSLHSLSFVNKDMVLNDISVYFSPSVFKSYLLAQSDAGFFESMNKNNVSYVAAVSPGRIIGNSGSRTKYTDPDCYEEIKGVKLECGEGNLTNKNASHERYEFDVVREVNVGGVRKGKQKLRIEIVLSKVDSAMYSQGYLVSEYTERLISEDL